MSSDAFRKWAQGDEFEPSAAQLNAWTDAARFAQQSLNRTDPVSPIGENHFTTLKMRNNTGAVIPQLGVVGFSAPMVLPSVSEARFVLDFSVDAITPAAPLDRFAISLQQVPSGAVFVAAVGGVLPCRVTGSGAKVNAISGDVNKLQAGTSGLELIWSEAGSSTRFGIVKLFGVGGSCTRKWQLFIFGNPSSGSFVIPVRAQYRDPDNLYIRSGAYHTENITIPYNATVTQTKNAIEGHTYIDADEVTVTGSLTLASSPHTIVMPEGVDFGAGTATIDSSGLVRRGLEIPRAYLSECCS